MSRLVQGPVNFLQICWLLRDYPSRARDRRRHNRHSAPFDPLSGGLTSGVDYSMFTAPVNVSQLDFIIFHNNVSPSMDFLYSMTARRHIAHSLPSVGDFRALADGQGLRFGNGR